MKTMIRHLGMPVPNRDEAVKFWESMGFNVVNLSNEQWGEDKLKIAKLTDEYGTQIEVIEGNWPPHIAIGVKEFPQGLHMINYQLKNGLETAFYDIEGVGVVEMVRGK